MPLICPKKVEPRYAFKTLGIKRRQRLAFCKGDVVEVTDYRRRNGKWVENYSRRIPSK